MSDGVLIALIVTAGSIIVGGIPLFTILVNRAVAKGSRQVSSLNTEEHLANSAKLDAISVAVQAQGTTLDRVETTVLRQSEVLSEHLSWHLHSPLVTPKEAA